MPDRVFAAAFVFVAMTAGWLWNQAVQAGVPWAVRVPIGILTAMLLWYWLTWSLMLVRRREQRLLTRGWLQLLHLLDEFIGEGAWLNGKWELITRRCSPEARDAAADAVDRWRQRIDGKPCAPIDRWWRK